jgi:hypothetical protein
MTGKNTSLQFARFGLASAIISLIARLLRSLRTS